VGSEMCIRDRQCLTYWALANGRTVEREKKQWSKGRNRTSETWSISSLLKAIDETLSEIAHRKLGLYDSANKLVDYLRREDYSSSTRVQFRSYLPEFFVVTLGSKNFSREDYDTLVPTENAIVETKKKIPKIGEVRTMVSYTNPEYRALIGTFTVIGWRISEILSRKWSHLKIRPEGYGRLEIEAKDTKARYARAALLTPEVVTWLKKFHELLPKKSEWLFPGYEGGHLSSQTAEWNLKNLFEKAGLTDDKDEKGNVTAIYSSHSFRTLADGLLSKCGLDRKYIELTIGHKSSLGAGVSYKDFDAIEEQWKERCLTNRAMTIEPETIEIYTNTNPELEKRVAFLESLIHGIAKEKGKLAQLPEAEIEKLALEDKSEESEESR